MRLPMGHHYISNDVGCIMSDVADSGVLGNTLRRKNTMTSEITYAKLAWAMEEIRIKEIRIAELEAK